MISFYEKGSGGGDHRIKTVGQEAEKDSGLEKASWTEEKDDEESDSDFEHYVREEETGESRIEQISQNAKCHTN